MLWLPIARLLLLQLAVPALSVTPLHSTLPSAVKLTLPVGVLPLPLTVAVKVTLAPANAGVPDVDSAVVVAGKLAAATPTPRSR
jgi:hypothetical protein